MTNDKRWQHYNENDDDDTTYDGGGDTNVGTLNGYYQVEEAQLSNSRSNLFSCKVGFDHVTQVEDHES